MPQSPYRSQPADFHPLVSGSGASKLAASGIAPLVAAARGYSTVTDRDGLRRIASSLSHPERFVPRYEPLVAADDDDILVLPWFTLNDVATAAAATDGTGARSTITQLRPSTPAVDQNGKSRKYVFLAGTRTALDLHPATPTETITTAPQVLITEGVIKADAALTAHLIDFYGVTDDLSLGDPKTAPDRLEALLSGIPAPRRALILAVAGVGNWHKNPEWNSLDLTDRTVSVAFDGDIHTNAQVLNQARQMFTFLADSRHATPALIDLDADLVRERRAEQGTPANTKIGLDDFLADLGTWADLPELTVDSLPEPADAPTVTGIRVSEGALRVDPDRPWIVQEYGRNSPDEPPRWRDSDSNGEHVSGRVIGTEISRRASDEEIRSGRIDIALDSDPATKTTTSIEVTVTTDSDGGEIETHTVTGPHTILVNSPADWSRLPGTHLPSGLALRPGWPPQRPDSTRGRGPAWLAAVKGHRREEVTTHRSWEQMGWVPDGNGWCAFVIGETTIARDDNHTVRVGVTDADFSGASRFGVADHFTEQSFDQFREQFIADAREVFTAYVDNGPWQDTAYGVLSVAAMLRPTLPMAPTSTIFAHGPSNSGKSHWSSFVMSGWQLHGGTWTGDRLPGSATDSLPAMEDTISRTPVWVADDLAPSSSRAKQESREATLADILRAVHNHSSRRRMDGTSGKQRNTPAPTALLVVTAENPLDVDSAVQRAVMLPFTKGVFTTDKTRTEGAVAARDADEPAASRLVGGMIRYWLMPSTDGMELPDTWAARVQMATEMKAATLNMIRRFLSERFHLSGGDIDRQAHKVSDLALALFVLRVMLSQLGVAEDDPMMRALGWGEGAYMSQLLRFAVEGANTAKASAPGRGLIEALGSVLSSLDAHVDNPTHPGMEPVIPGPNDVNAAERAAFVNAALGWRMDTRSGAWVPCGERIGSLVHRTDDEGNIVSMVVLDSRKAFHVAARHHPDVILPGQKQKTTWASVYAEGLTDSEYPRTETGHPRVPVTPGSQHRVSGVPVPLLVMLGEEAAESAASALAAVAIE